VAIPIIKLNLVPQKNFWQTYHVFISWLVLVLGGLILVWSMVLTLRVFFFFFRSEKQLYKFSSRSTSPDVADVSSIAELKMLDVAKALPMWQLAERSYAERIATWSRITEELERSCVQNVRITSIVRNSFSSSKGIKVRIVGEALSRNAEVAFIESLKKNIFFEQILLENESERPEGVCLYYKRCLIELQHYFLFKL
jgi:hypothetical protein